MRTNTAMPVKIVAREHSKFLLGVLAQYEQRFLVAVKTSLANLLLFTASDLDFAAGGVEPGEKTIFPYHQSMVENHR